MRQDPRFPNLFIVDHPLVQHKLTIMRDKNTPTKDFRALLREIAMLVGYEVTKNLPLTTKPVETPLAQFDAPVLADKKCVLVPILRAGLGMTDGLLDLMPSARVGHIGLYRDETTHKPVEYMVKLPKLENRLIIVVDPMVATGHSSAHAVHVLKQRGAKPEQIVMMALVAAPEGVAEMLRLEPDVKIYVAALDSHLNENAYIVPGLGDAGDRIFGTK
ncbi:MAG TPA: uracil phosphoribosyltransferase [Sutterella sp.]|nr:uracil phosphoribosyltransferase [Sutterella sp.]